MKEISLIGATGSIGTQTLSVIERYPEKFKLMSIVVNSSAEEFLAIIKKFRPVYAAIVDKSAAAKIKYFIPSGVKFGIGEQAALNAVNYGDTCVVAATGFAGLKYSLKAIAIGKNLALANKETLVCGGDLVMREIEKKGVSLMPIDSEHSAIWQALGFDYKKPFQRLIITASGGPFYSYTKEQLSKVKPENALCHPTWKMGAKITVDSATLLNKGFEVIEAHHLYNAPLKKIHTLVQPESIVHSMVEFSDGGVIAQLSYPSMELPIQLALTYPERIDCGLKPLNFEKLGAIHFLPLERRKFPCYHLALSAIEDGDNYPCALNAAGEVAVKAFLTGKIHFTDISRVIENVLCNTKRQKADDYNVLKETDLRARRDAENALFEILR